MKKVLLSACALLALAGCATQNTNPGVYSAGRVFSEGRAQTGVVLSVSQVSLQKAPSGYAALGGAVVGGLLGRQIGGGSGRDVGTAVGAVVGGNIASSLSSGSRVVPGYVIVVKSDRGRTTSYVQDQSVQIVPGMRVVVIGQGRDSRVFPG